MDLFRLHAYSVDPQRTTKSNADPIGGAVVPTAQLKQVIEENALRAAFPERTAVHFNVDPVSRTNETRDRIIDYAFGEPPTAKAAAVWLATRLSQAMDLRSPHALFILAADRDDAGELRRVTLWTFPRDDAFQFRPGRDGPSIQVLSDVFSQTSRLRKAAFFEGRRLRNQFLTGRALDFQADNFVRAVADFWIARFLDCSLAIADSSGTRLLARTLQKALESCEDPTDREQLFIAGVSIRRSPQKRVSLRAFADRYLADQPRVAFLAAAPNKESLNDVFEFQVAVFDATVRFRIFQLNTGVFVSSPLSEIDESVKLTGTQTRRLACSGVVVDEKLRTRHA